MPTILVRYFLLSLLFTFLTIQSYANRESDSLALVALYNSTDGPNWTNTWDLSTPMNNWAGIELDNQGRVVTIRLRGVFHGGDLKDSYGLSGQIPKEIGRLTELRVLNLSANRLTGGIPEELYNLKRLEHLDLSYNEFWVYISQNIANLRNLVSLNLAYSRIYSLPSTIAQLSNLRSLNIRGSGLDELPNSIFNLRELVSLDLSYCSFEISRFTNILRLSKLQSINISGVWAQEYFPPDISRLKELRHITIRSAEMTGRLPASLSELIHLETIDLRDNNFNSDIASNINQLSTLITLDLEGNEITNTIFDILKNNKTIRSLRLSSNRLGMEFPTEVFQMDNLEVLDLSYNSFEEGDIPGELFQNSNLKVLELAYCGFTGIPDEISSLQSIIVLDLSGNNFDSTFPSDILTLTTLQELNLSRTGLQGSIPSDIGQLNMLRELNLSNNDLTGQIPNEIGELESLIFLYLSHNMIQGDLPSSIGKLSSLVSLDLEDNAMSISPPQGFYSLNQLQNLNLSDNRLIEGITISWDSFTNLEILYLDNMGFSGIIPENISRAHSLRRLYMNDNNLSGQIPIIYDSLNVLEELHLYNNQYDSLPSNIELLKTLSFLGLGNNNIVGPFSSVIDSLQVIRRLDLQQNRLTQFDSNLLFLGTLWHLDISYNEIVDSLPSTIGDSLESLRTFYINNNEFYSELPISFYDLRNMNDFNGSFNKIIGIIDDEFEDWHWIREFKLINNRLVGTLPSTLGEMESLYNLELQSNQLEGCFPYSYMRFCSFIEDQDSITLALNRNNSDFGVFDFTSNKKLVWEGSITNFCNGEQQIGASCDDGIVSTYLERVTANCECLGTPYPCVNEGSFQLSNEVICPSDSTILRFSLNDTTYNYSWNTGSNDPITEVDPDISDYTISATNQYECSIDSSIQIDFEIIPVPVTDYRKYLNITVEYEIDVFANDIFDGVSDYFIDYTLPSSGTLLHISEGDFVYTTIENYGNCNIVSFEYALCNSLCPETCNKAEVIIELPVYNTEVCVIPDLSCNKPNGSITLGRTLGNKIDELSCLTCETTIEMSIDSGITWINGAVGFDGLTNDTYYVSLRNGDSILMNNQSIVLCDEQCNRHRIRKCEGKWEEVITPNGDGYNEVLDLDCLGSTELYGGCDLKIFNRWGDMIFEAQPYLDNWTGDGLPEGTYYFKLISPSEDYQTVVGSVTVVR